MSYIIKDWAGNVKFSQTFESFDDAWEFLMTQFTDLPDNEFEETLGEYEVVPVKGNGEL